MLKGILASLKKDKITFKSRYDSSGIFVDLIHKGQQVPFGDLSKIVSNQNDSGVAAISDFVRALRHISSKRQGEGSSLLELFSVDELNAEFFEFGVSLKFSHFFYNSILFGNVLEKIGVDRSIFSSLGLPAYDYLNIAIKPTGPIRSKSFSVDFTVYDDETVIEIKSIQSLVAQTAKKNYLVTPQQRRLLDLLVRNQGISLDEFSRISFLDHLKRNSEDCSISLPKSIRESNFKSYDDIQVILGRELDGSIVIEPNLQSNAGISAEFSHYLSTQSTSLDKMLSISHGGERFWIALSPKAIETASKVLDLKNSDHQKKEEVLANPNDFFTNEQLGLEIDEAYSDRIAGFIFGVDKRIAKEASGSKNAWGEGFEDVSLLLRSAKGMFYKITIDPVPDIYPEILNKIDQLDKDIQDAISDLRERRDDYLTPLPPSQEKEIYLPSLQDNFSLSSLLQMQKKIEASNIPELEEVELGLANSTLENSHGSCLVFWNDAEIPYNSLKKAVTDLEKGAVKKTESVSFDVIVELPIENGSQSLLLIESEPPPFLNPGVRLKIHQQTGYSWLKSIVDLEGHDSKGAFLADDMGLGKTIQLLSLISFLKSKKEYASFPILVVAPLSLIEGSWINDGFIRFIDKTHISTDFFANNRVKKLNEIRVHYPKHDLYLEALKIQEEAKDNDSFRKVKLSGQLTEFLNAFKEEVGSSILMTSYETLRSRSFELAYIDFGLIVLDEAQRIKNHSSAQARAALSLKSRIRVAMTGTPIENSIMDLWSVMSFAVPKKLGTRQEFKQGFFDKIKKYEPGSAERLKLVEELESKLKPFWLRRTKSEVLVGEDKLPTIHHYDSVLVDGCVSNKHATQMSEIQLGIYKEKMAYFNSGKKGEKLASIRALLLSCSAPWLFTGDAIEWSNSDRLFAICPKLKITFDILEDIYKEPGLGSKVIVFANIIQIQNSIAFLISDWLFHKHQKKTPIEVYNGNVDDGDRHEMLERFKNADGFKVLIISPRVGGAGLNIAYANHVIHYTREWNPALESQATDRVYRIGQTREVHVYYPTSVGDGSFQTAEEKLANILRKKREVINDFTISVSDFEVDPTTIVDVGIDSSRDVEVSFSDIPQLSAFEFEVLVALLYERNGYKTELLGRSGDSGADLVCFGKDDHLLIQVKQRQTSSNPYGNEPINEIRGADSFYSQKFGKVFKLAVVSNGHFSPKAFHHSRQGLTVKLVDGGDLSSMMASHSIKLSDIDHRARAK